jgi:two-component system sensor histidine kinase DesK
MTPLRRLVARAHDAAPRPAEAVQVQRARLYAQVLSLLFLLYVIEAGALIWHLQHGVARTLGIGDLTLLAVAFLVTQRVSYRVATRAFVSLEVCLALTAGVAIALGHAGALPLVLYFLIPIIVRLGFRALPAIVALGVIVEVAPTLIPSWHTGLDTGAMFSVLLTAVVVLVFVQLYRQTAALAEARTQLALLATELERTRIARDIHDVLGQALSAMALKAELAARLVAQDPDRAAREAEAVAALSRATLSQVRDTVHGLHQVSLETEFAAAKELLAINGIALGGNHRLEEVDPRYREVFGWVIKESTTNILRHAAATRVVIELARTCITVSDDGGATECPWGNGLRGLAERVEAAGGRLEVRASHGVTVQALMEQPA